MREPQKICEEEASRASTYWKGNPILGWDWVGSRGKRWSIKSPSGSGPRSLGTELKSDLVSVLIVPVLGCVAGGRSETDRNRKTGEQGG